MKGITVRNMAHYTRASPQASRSQVPWMLQQDAISYGCCHALMKKQKQKIQREHLCLLLFYFSD